MADDLKKVWRERDRVTRAITTDGFFRAAVIHNTTVVQTAQANHSLSGMETIALGRALTGASLMASFLKGEERIALMFDGDGPVKSIYAEAIQVGEVRGYATLNQDPTESESALGKGLLKVQKVLYGKMEATTGIVELKRGDVTSDLGHYLTQSEQIPSAFVFDIAFDENDVVRQSVGCLIQAMPGARPEDIFKVYDTIDYLERLTEFADRGYDTKQILQQIMPSEITITATAPVDFFCRCSLNKFKSVLATLGVAELESMREQGHNELVCQYCNAKYYLENTDFDELREQILAVRN